MSDEPAASARLAEFSASRRRWLVSVLMVSEGVDIPRLRVGVYATAARTELFFRQVVGRFIRRTPSPPRQMSYLLLPADARLTRLAVQIEEERRHALELLGQDADEPVGLEPVRRGESPGFEALSSTLPRGPLRRGCRAKAPTRSGRGCERSGRGLFGSCPAGHGSSIE